MAVYLIGQVEIHDREEFRKYESGFIDLFSRSSGEFLAISEDPVVIVGSWPYTRTVLLRFPSREEAMKWYQSPEYQSLAQHRFRASSANFVIIEALA